MAYTVRTTDNAGDLGRAADQNESVNNDIYFKTYAVMMDYLLAGWVIDTATWTRISNTSFSVATDRTAIFRKGAKIRYKQGGAYKYGYVVNSVWGAVTTVTITGGADYVMAAGDPTDTYISYIENPEGFPDWFTYTVTHTGFAADPTYVAKFKCQGKHCIYGYYCSANGTSNAVGYTVTLPITAATSVGYGWTTPLHAVIDNGVAVVPGEGVIVSAATTATFYRAAFAAWTNANGKRADAIFIYEF